MKLFLIALIFAILSVNSFAYAQSYVFDSAKVLKKSQNIDSEIADLVNKNGIVIIVETENFTEERPRVVYDKFVKYGLNRKGRPDFNMVLVLNVGNGELYYRVSKGCALQEDEISAALNKAEIRQAYEKGDYDTTLLEAVKSLKDAMRKKLENYACPPRKQPVCKIDSEEPQIVKRTMKYEDRGKIKPAAIVLHYIDFPTVEHAVSILEDLGLSVQFMVEKDGTIYQLMNNPDDMAAGAKCANSYTISIEIVGSEESLLENKVQYNSVVKLVKWLAKKYDIDLSKKVASRPQRGLIAHSEVAALCKGADKKADPGDRYMQLVRADACPAVRAAGDGARGIVIDLTQKLSDSEISTIESPLVNDQRWQQEPPNIFLIAKSGPGDDTLNDAIEYTEDADAECVIIADKSDGDISFSREDCALSEEEFQKILADNRKDIDDNIKAGDEANAMRIVASDVAEEIYSASKENEAQKLAEEESLVAILSDFFDRIESSVYGVFVPASTNPSKDYEKQAELVMQRAAQFPPDSSRTKAVFEGAKRLYSPTPDVMFSHFPSSVIYNTLQEALINWHGVLYPAFIQPRFVNEEVSYFFTPPQNLKKDDFTVDVPNGLFCKIYIISFFDSQGGDQLHEHTAEELKTIINDVISNKYIILKRNVKCGAPAAISVYKDNDDVVADCISVGYNTCAVLVQEGILFTNYKAYTFSIDFPPVVHKSLDSASANKIANNFIQAIYSGVNAANKNKFGVKITPEELYTISLGEGMVLKMRRVYEGLSGYSTFSGFGSLGIDTIGDKEKYLKDNGFLRKDLALTTTIRYNEKGQRVTSADFSNIDDAMEAAAAMVAFYKAQFLQDAANLGVNVKTLSRRQVNFWTYYYFNIGEGGGFRQLRKFAVNGRLQDENFINAKPGEVVQNGRNARHNAIIRAVMMEFIYDTGIFSEGSVPVSKA